MQNEKINIIDVLIAEKENLLLKVAHINKLIDEYKKKNLDVNKLNIIADIGSPLEKYGSANYVLKDAFPKNGRIDEQIIFLLEKDSVIKKRSTIEMEIFEYTGVEVKIREQLRRMYNDRKLLQAKYNNSNKLSFYGLIEWAVDRGSKKPGLIQDYEPLSFGFSAKELEIQIA